MLRHDVALHMSPAFISGVEGHFPKAKITFEKFYIIAQASQAIDKMRREKQQRDPSLPRSGKERNVPRVSLATATAVPGRKRA